MQLAMSDKRNSFHHRAWQIRISSLQLFVSTNSRLPATKENNLGAWVSQIQREYSTIDHGILDRTRIDDLEKIPYWSWYNSKESSWESKYLELKYWFTKTNGTVPLTDIQNQHFSFIATKWISRQRAKYKKKRLSKERQAKLEQLPGWIWKGKPLNRYSFIERELLWRIKSSLSDTVRGQEVVTFDKRWEIDIALPELKIAVEYDGYWWHKDRASQDTAKNEALKSDGWQVLRIRETPLSTITNVDIPWNRKANIDDLLRKVLDTLVGWGATEKTLAPNFRKLSIDYMKIHDRWNEGYGKLLLYIKQYDTSQVPISYVCDDGFKLGSWVSVQRREKKKERLSLDKVSSLEALKTWRWEFSSHAHRGWDKAYSELEKAIQFLGAMPASRYRTEEGFYLGSWIATQKAQYRANTLHESRKNMLELIEKWRW